MGTSPSQYGRFVTDRVLRPDEQILAFSPTKTIGEMSIVSGPGFLAVTSARLIDTSEVNWTPMSSTWEDIAWMAVGKQGRKWTFEYRRKEQSMSYGTQLVSEELASVVSSIQAGSVPLTKLAYGTTRGILTTAPMDGWALADYARSLGIEDVAFECEWCKAKVAGVVSGEISPNGPTCYGCLRTVTGYEGHSA